MAGWRLWKHGTEVALPALPPFCYAAGSCEPQTGPVRAAFSSTGRILAITPGGAYLYSLYG